MTLVKKIPLYTRLEIETHSTCNRRCVTCLRNSIPDREVVKPWFEPNSLPIDDFKRVLHEARDMGFRDELCLSHYNEPLMDDRFVELATYARSLGTFRRIFFCSNADFLTEEIATALDGLIDDIGFSFYMDEPIKGRRMKWVNGLFKKTKLILSPGVHMVTHYSPMGDLIQLGNANRGKPCALPQRRMIVNHKGEMLLCCDDMVGNFGLGTIYDGKTVEEMWYSDKHQEYVLALMQPDGRKIHPHCMSCPRP